MEMSLPGVTVAVAVKVSPGAMMSADRNSGSGGRKSHNAKSNEREYHHESNRGPRSQFHLAHR